MFTLIAVARVVFLSFLFASKVLASPCVVFDSNFNLLVFGLGTRDLSLGKRSQWESVAFLTYQKVVSSKGRPPFDGENTTCYLAQYFNAIYVLNGDKSKPSEVFIYDATADEWSTQKTTLGTFKPATATAILDHDTNVFYAYSGGNLFGADFGSLISANSTAIEWSLIGEPNFPTTNYRPLMGLARNHIHFLNAPGSKAGTARIFVIHYSYFQPEVQDYPVRGSGSDFPATDGHVATIFKPEGEGAQQEFFFIPHTGSHTYVINVERNSTTVLKGPTDKSASTFTAGVRAIVQLTSKGELFYLPYEESDSASAQAKESWKKISAPGLPRPSSTSTSTSAKKTSSPTLSTKAPSTTKLGGASGLTASLSLSVTSVLSAVLLMYTA